MSKKYTNKQAGFLTGIDAEASKPIDTKGQDIEFMLNGILGTFEGDLQEVSNEPGNIECFDLPEGFTQIGAINIGRDRTLIFSVSDALSELGEVTECNFTSLIKSSCLGFNKCNLIKGLYRVLNYCDDHVYFFDCLNSDKTLNLSNLGLYTQEGYTVEQANAEDKWDCNKMKLNPDFVKPCVNIEAVLNSGGIKELGTYKFVGELLDQALNSIGFSTFTRAVPIYDESTNNPYNSIDGGYTLDDVNLAGEGGVPSANKSIRLELSNLDTNFSYIRLYVIRYITGDGFTKEVYQLGNLISINSDTITYTFSGINTANGDFRTDISALVLNRTSYERTCGDMEFVDKRLLRVNVRKKPIDYGIIQQAAMNLDISYVVKQIEKRNIQDFTDKNPLSYIDCQSYPRDEIISLGISGTLKSGEKLPAFHIPGRASVIATAAIAAAGNANSLTAGNHTRNFVPIGENWDTQSLTITSPITDANTQVKPEDVISGDTGAVPRYKVHNTAYKTQPGVYYSRGQMGYHECENAVYPDITICDGTKLYGDSTGTPIRHHRLPDNMLEPIADGDYIYKLGLSVNFNAFLNLVPQEIKDEVACWYLVQAKRTEPTVLDTGYVFPLAGCTDDIEDESYICVGAQSGFLSGTSEEDMIPTAGASSDLQYILLTPKTQFKKEYYNQYLKTAGLYAPDPDLTIDPFDTSGSIHDWGDGEIALSLYTTWRDSLPVDTDIVHRDIESAIYVNADSVQSQTQTFPSEIRNESITSDFLFTRVSSSAWDNRSLSSAADDKRLWFVTVKDYRDPYCNLETINYYPISESCCTDFVNSVPVIFAGDVFIAPLSLHNQFHHSNLDNPSNVRHLHVDLYVESTINVALRHTGTDDCRKYFNKPNTSGDYLTYIRQLTKVNETSPDEVCPNSYLYNDDYSVSANDENLCVALPVTFDYCNSCSGIFSNAAVWSNRSFTEEQSDGMRVFLPNNITNIGVGQGELTNAHFDKNELILTTDQAMFQVIPNPRQLQAEGEAIYTGNGDFFSIPERQFLKTNYGYAGNQGRFNSFNTEFGYLTIDQRAGEIFLKTGQGLSKMSDIGLRNWFKDNLPSELKKQVRDAGGELVCDDSTVARIGLQSVYDPRFKRVIIHKADYKAINFGGIDNTGTNANLEAGKIYYNDLNDTWIYFDQAFGIQVINVGDDDYFENKSWTISFDLLRQKYISHHSYQPSFMWNTVDRFYSVNFDSQIWEHTLRNYQHFYGEYYPYILELSFGNYATRELHSLTWHSRTREYDEVNKSWLYNDDTFNKGIIYNDTQSTGLMNFILKSDYGSTWSTNNKQISLSEHDYSLSGIIDIAVNQPVITSDWSDPFYNSFFNQSPSIKQGYIDHVPLYTSLNLALSQYEQGPLRGKYTNVRLIFETDKDQNIITSLLDTKTFYSNH